MPASIPRSTTDGITPTTKEGPLPQTIETIRLDNRKLVKELLLSDPRSNKSSSSPSTSPPHLVGAGLEESSNQLDDDPFTLHPPPSSEEGLIRQRLVFATTSLQNVILRHVLAVPKADEVYARLKKLHQQNQQQKDQKDKNGQPGDEVMLPKSLGIIASRVLLHEEEKFYDTKTKNQHKKHTTLGIGIGGTEVSLLSPPPASSSPLSTGNIQPKKEEEDFMDDEDMAHNAPLITLFVRNDMDQVRSICSYIKRMHRKTRQTSSSSSKQQPHYRIVFVPHITSPSEKILLDECILPLLKTTVSITSIPLDLIPIDSDVMTLDVDTVLRDVELKNVSMDVVTTVARSVMKLQDVITGLGQGGGHIKRIQSLGPLGEAVIGKVFSMRLEEFSYDHDDDYDDDDDDDDGDDNISSDEKIENIVGREADAAGGKTASVIALKEKEDITAMLVLDRRVDMVTPMLTPLTYEGLLDEVLGIDCGFIKVDTNVIDPPSSHQDQSDPLPTPPPTTPAEPTILNLPLNDIDNLYSEVRDQHVEKFGSFLQEQIRALKESHSAFTDKGKKKDLNEIHQFVKKIPIFTKNFRSLSSHIHLAELVKQTTEESSFQHRWQTERSMVESEQCYDMLEDLIACQEPPYQLLRLLCLQSLTSGGIKSAKFDSLRREVVQTYGYDYLFVLNNLEKANLLRRKDMSWMDTTSPFSSLRKQLALINAEVNTIEPDDVSYVSSGYAPLTARLVQTSTQGWTGKDEALRELPGRLIDVTQRDIPVDFATALKNSSVGPGLVTSIPSINTATTKKPVLVVYFVGGISLMEIASLRFLSKRPTFPFSILICTTKIVNGSTLLKSLS